jgi:hypothetical protein
MGDARRTRQWLGRWAVLPLVFLLGALVAPVAAQAVGQFVTIVDNNDDQAEVDKGALRVGDGVGPLTVNGTIQIGKSTVLDVRSADLVRPYVAFDQAGYRESDPIQPAIMSIPAGQTLLIREISAYGFGSADKVIVNCALWSPRGLYRVVLAVPRVLNGHFDRFAVTEPFTTYMTSAHDIRCTADVSPGNGFIDIDVTITGELVSSAPIAGF